MFYYFGECVYQLLEFSSGIFRCEDGRSQRSGDNKPEGHGSGRVILLQRLKDHGGKLPKGWEEAFSLDGRARWFLRSRKRHCGIRWSVVAQGKEISEKPGSPVERGREGQVVDGRESRSGWALG